MHYLEFEKPLLEMTERITALRTALGKGEVGAEKDMEKEVARLTVKQARVARLLYRNLDAAQKVQVARHPGRPQGDDYISALLKDFVPLAGDRRFGEDKAILAGIGLWQGTHKVAVVATRKGKTTTQRLERNFGMPKPEGYRTAMRVFDLANRFGLPIITLVDTPGAYPGIEAEERGQAEAIAASMSKLLDVNVPVITIITGEGGSGGALALAVADEVLMLEHAVYSVISPEGCAAILWKEANKETIPQAASALKLTAQDLEKLGLIDGLIKEPVGGAHRDESLTITRVGDTVSRTLLRLKGKSSKENRRKKFLALGHG
ncbi:MAG: acetyl-CoA carboxylase carboxyl transferase subunit alpha [Alphaproteobacteria bacterium CG_4_10_14_0_8_um_filter_53_9]|nr:MAG: acetyl-CoA carboxylase carboxyl transferase subunit alpha [Alphaproteobacteria bacterium CG_4_10_14_0_8_um_filter_53_9]